MIKPKCWICNQELTDYGALIFSPPEVVCDVDKCVKLHVCKKCYYSKVLELKGK